MQRRDFIAGVGAAAAVSDFSTIGASAQQPGRQRRVGILMNYDATDARAQSNVKAFTESLAKAGCGYRTSPH